MDLINLQLDKFVAATASGEPVPGGGSISALCGSLAAALGEMVAHLTIGKKKYAEVQPEMEKIVEKISPAVGLLLRAVDLDSQAYDFVFQAYKLPKDTDEEKAARTESIQQALKHAATVPFTVARITASFLPDLFTVAEKGNQNAITDAYVATLCARTAILGACANVRINLSSINDTEFVEEMAKDVAALEDMAFDCDKKVRELVEKAF